MKIRFIIQIDDLIKSLSFQEPNLIPQSLILLFKGFASLILFILFNVIVLLIFLQAQLVSIYKLVISIFYKVSSIEDYFLVYYQVLNKFFISTSEVRILSVSDEMELFLFLLYEFHIVFEVLCELLIVVTHLFLGVVQLFSDYLLNESVNICLYEEGVPDTWLIN